MQESSCKCAGNGTGTVLKDAGKIEPGLATVTIQVPFPVPVLAFLEEEARKDSRDYTYCLITSVLCGIKRRFKCYYHSSSNPAEIAKYRHLLSLMTEHGELLLAGDQAIEQHSSQQEGQHGATAREDTSSNVETVLIDLAVPMPAPVLEQLEQQALEDGDDFKRTLVADLIAVLQEVLTLDIPAGAGNGRYRELYFLLDEVDV